MNGRFPDSISILSGLRRSVLRRPFLLALDGLIAGASLWLALVLRFEGDIRPTYERLLPTYLLLLVAARVVSSRLFRLDRWSFLLSGLQDAVRVCLSGLFGTGLFILGTFFLRVTSPPRSVVALELLLSTALMGLARFSPRVARAYRVDHLRGRRDTTVRTVIVGAGAAGEMLLRDLQRSADHDYAVIGFVDDDPGKWGSIVGGKPVLGGIDELPTIAERYRLNKVLIAIPRLAAGRVREILSLCSDLKLRFKILPVSWIYLNERAPASMLQDLAPEDLLQRESVNFAQSAEAGACRGRTVLVTGAAGSIGGEICSQLLKSSVGHLIMVDLNENGLYTLERRFRRAYPDARIAVEVAELRESQRIGCLFARHRPQDVFHAAAHKHVPLMEEAPCEAVKNNVLATRSVIDAAIGHKAERFVLISTDKAVKPSSVMGATKRVAEMVVQSLGAKAPIKTCSVRFGNVLGSAGSVVPLFREQIAAGGPVTVTHPEVRRYFMTISEAVGLVLKAAYGDYGELCILDMGEPICITDLARLMITMAGLNPDEDISIVFEGLRPGEKLFEELLTEEEEQTFQINEKIYGAESPSPPPGFDSLLQSLLSAAVGEKDEEALQLLSEIVPSFRREQDEKVSIRKARKARMFEMPKLRPEG